MPRIAFRGAALPALLAAGLFPALTAAPAGAQDEGDQVILVLTSGKKFTGTLVSRDGAQVKIRIGTSDVALPASMVATIERVETETEEEEEAPPAKSPAAARTAPADREPAKARGPAAVRPTGRRKMQQESREEPAPAAAPAEEGAGEPRMASLLLKDGTVLEGFVIAKVGGRIFIVPGEPVVVDESDVEEAYGQTEPPAGAGKGITFSGDATRDATRMIEELGSGERSRVIAARAVLEGLGREAIPALLLGLKSPEVAARVECVSRLQEVQATEAIEPITSILRNDPDPGVRAKAAAKLGIWDPPGIRRVILEAVWRDSSETVKVSGLMSLEKTAGPEEASALIDLLAILPDESKAYPSLFRVLRKATAERMGDDSTAWNAWWDDGGRDRMAQLAEMLAERRQKAEEAKIFGRSAEEPAAPAAPAGTPGGMIAPPTAPPGSTPGSPQGGPEGGGPR